MTQRTKSVLTLLFEQGDVPTGTNYADLIDSYVNQSETAVQNMAGPLAPTELITARVSATNVNVTGTLTIAGQFSANNLNANTLTINTDISAGATVYSSAERTGYVIQSTGTVSAAGTTQGAAASLTNVINRGKGIADGVTTGFTPLANRAGMVQYLLNEGASANLWPPTGGFINGLAVNVHFPLAASAAYTIFHITASSYGVHG